METESVAILPKTESSQSNGQLIPEQDRFPKTTAPQPGGCGVA
ncbi:MAG: hypothetical protein P8J37_01540 [Fuerstiella sp.]|nr:hypothetical protein [Fuerstiella sp.]